MQTPVLNLLPVIFLAARGKSIPIFDSNQAPSSICCTYARVPYNLRYTRTADCARLPESKKRCILVLELAKKD